MPLCVRLLHELHRWKICSIVLSCSHPASQRHIDAVQQYAASLDIDFSFVAESGLNGTGGAVRALSDLDGDDPVLIVSANMLGNVSISPSFRLDRALRPDAATTVLVARASQTSALDRVRIGDSGHVHEIVTGPVSNGQFQDEWTSAGAWVLSTKVIRDIPANRYCCIREQLLPELLHRGESVRAVPINDEPIADSTATHYLHLHQQSRAAAASETPPVPGYRQIADRVWAAPTAVIPDGTKFSGHAIIGADCRLEDEVTIEGFVSIGDGSTICRGATIRESILWNKTRIGADVVIQDSIVTDHVTVPPQARLSKKVLVSRTASRAAVNLMRHATNGDSALYIDRSPRRLTPLSNHSWRRRMTEFMKRTMDVTVAVIVLGTIWPLMLVAMAAIKLESPGPVLFRQQRCTRDGKLFTMLKLRTMVSDAEQQLEKLRSANEVDGPMFKIRHDPRITRVGAFLRNTSLDEVPQMINVLRGEMSLVGPRPLAPGEMIMAPHWRDLRLKVKPGMTGLWQLYGRRQHAFSDWIKYDIRYVKNHSMVMDFKILVRTGLMVLQSFWRQSSDSEESN